MAALLGNWIVDEGVEEKETPAPASRVVGFIDLGSNSLRLLVARITDQGVVHVLNEARQMVRLGEDAFERHRLKPEAMERTLLTLGSFAGMCRGYGVDEYVAVATAAVRDADNGEEFLHRVRRELGIDFGIVSGKEEARLVWRGVSQGWQDDVLRLCLDIGGGSTELAAATADRCLELESLKIGCVRLANLFPVGEGLVSEKTFESMKMYVRSLGVHAFRRIGALDVKELVASSGTAQNLAQMTALLTGGLAPSANTPDTPTRLSCRGLCRCVRELCSRSRAERAALPGLNPRRLDVIVQGAAILQTVLEEMSVDTATITSRSLRDGLVREYVERTYPALDAAAQTGSASVTPMGVREKSVLRLGRACRFEEEHSRHVARLALELFDSARKLRLHDEGEETRELLRYAGLLHDIGIFIGFSRHHAHSHYLIRNTELLGFEESEVRLIAAMAYFHRARPSKKHAVYEELDEDAKRALRPASLFLTMAEALDKSHGELVASARFLKERKKYVLEVRCRSRAPLEEARLARLEPRLNKLCDGRLKVNFVLP